MPHDAKDFYKYGKPVGELFQTLSESYFDTYEEGRPFGEGVDDTYPDEYPESRWGLDLGCVQHNTPAWGESCLRSVQNHVLYHIVANAQSNRETLTAFFANPDEDPSPDKALQNLSNAWRDGSRLMTHSMVRWRTECEQPSGESRCVTTQSTRRLVA